MNEMFRDLPFPFKDERFPRQLAAYVTRAVLAGDLPVLCVIHTPENWWIVTDMQTDPDDANAAQWAHLLHVLERDPSLSDLSTLPLATAADRPAVGAPWTFSPYQWRE